MEEKSADNKRSPRLQCAMEQLPKVLHAMSNMARRSRTQLQKKGILLGGRCWEKEYPRNQGILKNRKSKSPTLAQIAAMNEFWKTYVFSFGYGVHSHDLEHNHAICTPALPRRLSFLTQSSSNPALPNNLISFEIESLDRRCQICKQIMSSSSLRDTPSGAFMDIDSYYFATGESLQRISLAKLDQTFLTPKEEDIFNQIEYIRMLLQIPLHKLLRKRPKEFVLPLPRRSTRSLQSPSSRSLVLFQSVPNLSTRPEKYCKKWRMDPDDLEEFDSPSPFKLHRKNKSRHVHIRGFSTSVTIIPKGVAFITYPDSVDETSFEGTIGGRRVISWEKGTKFPQMGIDQSDEFRSRKEMGRQHMVQSRMRGARRVHTKNMIIIDNNGNEAEEDRFRRQSFSFSPARVNRRARNTKTCRPLIRSCLKVIKVRKTLRGVRRSFKVVRANLGNSTFPSFSLSTASDREKVLSPAENVAQRIKTAKRLERRQRLKMFLMAALRILSCGIIPYLMTGEWKIFKRKKHLRTADSRDRCNTPAEESTPQQEPKPPEPPRGDTIEILSPPN